MEIEEKAKGIDRYLNPRVSKLKNNRAANKKSDLIHQINVRSLFDMHLRPINEFL